MMNEHILFNVHEFETFDKYNTHKEFNLDNILIDLNNNSYNSDTYNDYIEYIKT